eukprot:m.135192 g.135192  ORF g.135192 m.135192 type:complete len:470 (+) comp17555_c0_seq47:678-2087(+)
MRLTEVSKYFSLPLRNVVKFGMWLLVSHLPARFGYFPQKHSCGSIVRALNVISNKNQNTCTESLTLMCVVDVQRRNRTPMPLPTDRNSTDSSSQNGASHNPSNTEVPLLISSCIKFLSKAPNISQEGIFRECGGADEVKTLTDGFARGVDMLGGAADVSAHAAASCLKQFLRQRTDTVLGTNNYADWIGVACLRKHDEKLKAARRILATSMSSDNLNILYTLIPFLRNVTDYTEKNRMTLSALATVFGPTLLAPPAGTDLLSQKADVDAGIKIVELLVSEQDTLLNDLPSPAPTHERESNIYDEVECAATPLRHARTPDLEKAPDAVPVDNERERRAPRAATEVLQRSAEQRTSPVVDANGNYTVVLSRTTEESFGVDFETLDNDFKVVCWVTKGGLADGRVAVDDTILAINGFECRRWTHATIVDVLKTASTIELSMAKIPGTWLLQRLDFGGDLDDIVAMVIVLSTP